MKQFEWTWVGLLFINNDYGHDAARIFQKDLAETGLGCLAYLEVLPWGHNPAELRRIVTVMKTSTARVVVLFVYGSFLVNLMKEVRVMMMMLTMGI